MTIAEAKDIPTEDYDLILKIVGRLHALSEEYPNLTQIDLGELQTAITTAYRHNSFDLKRLLEFADVDLLHDVLGIMRHLDRDTGEFKDCFLPRCSR